MFLIFQEKAYLILPYIVVITIEFFLLLISLIASSFLVELINESILLAGLIPVGILLLLINCFFWIILLKLFQQIENEIVIEMY